MSGLSLLLFPPLLSLFSAALLPFSSKVKLMVRSPSHVAPVMVPVRLTPTAVNAEIYAKLVRQHSRLLTLRGTGAQLAGAVAEEFRPGKSRTMSDEQLDSHMEQVRAKYEETVVAIQQFTQG